MAVALHYLAEFGKPALQKTICGGIYARVYCIFSACTMSLQRKFTFAISSPDEFLVFNINRVDARRRVHSSIVCHHLSLHVSDRPPLPSGHAPRCLGIFPRVARLWHHVQHWAQTSVTSSVTAVLPPPGQCCGTVCLTSFGSWTSPSDNSNDRWKRLCLASRAASPCVRTLMALTRNLLTYLLTCSVWVNSFFCPLQGCKIVSALGK